MELSRPTKRLVLVIGISAIVIIAAGSAYYRSFEALPFILGVIMTSALNAGKVFLLERTVKKTLDLEDPDIGKNYVRFQYLFRYFITGLVLLAAGLIGSLTPHISIIWGAVAGIFTMQIAVIIVRVMKPVE